MDAYRIIKGPVISEKTTDLNTNNNQVVFKVDKGANKDQIKLAVEKIYPKVKVSSVRTIVMPGKPKRVRNNVGFSPSWKKAVVQLEDGSKIDFH